MDPKENNQVIIFKNDDDDGKRHFTWSDYCHFVYVFKYWILGITLVFAIIGYLLISLWWNPGHAVSTAHVRLELPLTVTRDSNNSTTEIEYLDGSSYSMYDIISSSNIEKVIENTKDEEGNLIFSFLDAKEIVEDNAISIRLDTTTNANGESVTADRGSFQYVITCSTGAFGSTENVSAFVEALIQSTYDEAISKIPTNHLISNIPTNYTSLTPSSLLGELITQYQAIDSLYTELLDQFESTTEVNEGQILREVYNNGFRAEYASQNGSSGTIFQDLQDEADLFNYVRFSESNISSAVNSCIRNGSILTRRLDDTSRSMAIAFEGLNGLRPSIESGTASSSMQDQYTQYMTQYTTQLQRQQEILAELTSLGYRTIADESQSFYYAVEFYLPTDENYDPALDNGAIQHLLGTSEDDIQWRENCLAFVSEMDAYVERLDQSLEEANEVYNILYSSKPLAITYSDSSKFVTDGEMSSFLGAAAGLILGYLLSSVILASYGYIKAKKGIPVLADGTEDTSASIVPVTAETTEEKKEDEEQKDTDEESTIDCPSSDPNSTSEETPAAESAEEKTKQ